MYIHMHFVKRFLYVLSTVLFGAKDANHDAFQLTIKSINKKMSFYLTKEIITVRHKACAIFSAGHGFYGHTL